MLWLGNTRDLREWKVLLDKEIEAVVDLAAEEEPAHLPRQLIYCRCPLIDGEGNSQEALSFAVDIVVGLLARKKQTLLACSAGLSRSPTIAAQALARIRNVEATAIVHELTALKPIDIHPALWSTIPE